MGNKQSQGTLTKEQIEELTKRTNYDQETLKTLCKTFAEDHPDSDCITKEEFKKYFATRLGDGPLLDGLWNTFDEDKSGTLDFKELILAFSMVEHGNMDQKLEVMFRLYDKDNSGSITRDECSAIMENLLKIADTRAKDDGTLARKLHQLVLNLDVNSDGKITLDEWVREWKVLSETCPYALELLTNEMGTN